MAIYMNINNMKGNVSTNNYKNWIALDAAYFAVNTNVKSHTGNMYNRQSSLPAFSDLEIHKSLDNASNGLFDALCKSKTLSNIEIHVLPHDNSACAKYVLSDVLVSNGETLLHTDNKPQEIWHLNYAKIETSYIGRDSQNRATSPVTSTYDLVTAE